MKVYLGILKYLGIDGLLNLLEADYDTPLATGRSYFERELGADYLSRATARFMIERNILARHSTAG